MLILKIGKPADSDQRYMDPGRPQVNWGSESNIAQEPRQIAAKQ